MAHQIISELAQICLQLGIDHAVISPGSRNAPLIIAFTKNPAFRCFSISDERSAGYFALGMARQLLDQMSRNDEAVVIAENLSNLFGREFIDTPEPFLARLSGSDRKDFTPGLLVTIYLPPGCSLHLANSTPVRYAQLFSSNPGLLYYSNRGVSGIDGCISSAAGAAIIDKRLTVLLSGDIAFIYDASGLWDNQLAANLRIIVFNNDGGNIFKLIQSSPGIMDIEHFFETPHKANLKALSAAFGLDHYFASNKERLEEILQPFFEPKDRAAVLEIKTSGTVSAKVFKQYFHHLSKQNEQ